MGHAVNFPALQISGYCHRITAFYLVYNVAFSQCHLQAKYFHFAITCKIKSLTCSASLSLFYSQTHTCTSGFTEWQSSRPTRTHMVMFCKWKLWKTKLKNFFWVCNALFYKVLVSRSKIRLGIRVIFSDFAKFLHSHIRSEGWVVLVMWCSLLLFRPFLNYLNITPAIVKILLMLLLPFQSLLVLLLLLLSLLLIIKDRFRNELHYARYYAPASPCSLCLTEIDLLFCLV